MATRQAVAEQTPNPKQVRNWIEEREAEKKKAAVAAARVAALDALLIWARMSFSEDIRNEIFSKTGLEEELNKQEIRHVEEQMKKPIVRPTRFSRIGWMNTLMLSAEQGLTDSEIWQRVKAQPPASGTEETSRTIQKLIENMCRRGRLRRRGSFVYHPATLARIEAGELQDRTEAKRPRRGDIRAIIRKALTATGNAPAKVIIAKLWKMPEARTIMEQSPAYPYAMLSRMAHAGELDRKNGTYCLPRDH